MTKIINGKNGIVCAFCGKEKTEVIFCIGASSKKDWCMIEGTGKMTCPDCYDLAMLEGQAVIETHIAAHNASAERLQRLKANTGQYAGEKLVCRKTQVINAKWDI